MQSICVCRAYSSSQCYLDLDLRASCFASLSEIFLSIKPRQLALSHHLIYLPVSLSVSKNPGILEQIQSGF